MEYTLMDMHGIFDADSPNPYSVASGSHTPVLGIANTGVRYLHLLISLFLVSLTQNRVFQCGIGGTCTLQISPTQKRALTYTIADRSAGREHLAPCPLPHCSQLQKLMVHGTWYKA